jgi:hypothetical protein
MILKLKAHLQSECCTVVGFGHLLRPSGHFRPIGDTPAIFKCKIYDRFAFEVAIIHQLYERGQYRDVGRAALRLIVITIATASRLCCASEIGSTQKQAVNDMRLGYACFVVSGL